MRARRRAVSAGRRALADLEELDTAPRKLAAELPAEPALQRRETVAASKCGASCRVELRARIAARSASQRPLRMGVEGSRQAGNVSVHAAKPREARGASHLEL